MTLDVFSIYIHFPYCVQKCPYCDFNSYATHGKKLDDQPYTRAVLAELDARMPLMVGRKLVSIFFGGGTPSLWSPNAVKAIIEKISHFYQLSPLQTVEITLEANPSAIESHHLKEFKRAGVNRISMGVQALDDRLLKILGRIHGVEDAIESLKIIQDVGFRSHSIDFMYSIPSQTLDDWRRALDQIADLKTPHVSAYSLIYEAGTPLENWRKNKKITPISEETEAMMFELTHDVFHSYGYEGYEISNFALPGHRSLHNQHYWQALPYLGIGAGAHSFVNHDGMPLAKQRSENLRAPQAYIDYWLYRSTSSSLLLQKSAFEWTELLSDRQLVDEHILLGLRTTQGWNAERSEKMFHMPTQMVAEMMDKSFPQWCQWQAPYLKPLKQGLMMNNTLIEECSRCLDKILREKRDFLTEIEFLT